MFNHHVGLNVSTAVSFTDDFAFSFPISPRQVYVSLIFVVVVVYSQISWTMHVIHWGGGLSLSSEADPSFFNTLFKMLEKKKRSLGWLRWEGGERIWCFSFDPVWIALALVASASKSTECYPECHSKHKAINIYCFTALDSTWTFGSVCFPLWGQM